ncbi:MAG: ribonuclease R [Ancalomicrobiaceae bacterium]|nr:ribonuclease R [Ancalomicrobiaceae bacterium]
MPGELPSREQLLAFIAEHPGKAGKREIARAFKLSGGAKIALKRLLKELAEGGAVEKHRKRLVPAGELPEVLVANVGERDGDGELLAVPDEWDEEDAGPAPKILVLPDAGRRSGPAAGVGDRLLVKIVERRRLGEEAPYAARVIRVLEKRPAAGLGILRVGPDGSARVLPIDKKSKEYAVAETDLKDARDGDLVSIDVARLGRFGLPRAKVREVIGSMATEKAVTEIALLTHAIPHVFSPAVLAEAEECREATMAGREDWRRLPLVTIDPPDAKDHDDAVYAEPDLAEDNPNGFVVTVAIADVAAYVRPGTGLDREALRRGNSVYFPDRVVPMLPERISNDLCSLKEKVDRPAIAVKMRIGPDGHKIEHKFHRIMMRSAAKLSYQEAQSAIDGHPNDHTETIVDCVLKPLWAAYAALKRGREKREPLDLDLPERKILLKPDGTVDKVVVPVRLDAHKLIEEFMIQANVAAAETLEKHHTPLVYRIHDAPSPEKIEGLKDFLATLDVKLASKGGIRPSNLNRILERFAGSPQAGLVNEVVLRSQAQAEYNPLNIGHFGLNLRRYAHFTSPIRRYADLIVHRALIRALRLGSDGLPEAIDEKLEAIGAEISAAERRAMLAERETNDRLIARHLVDRVGAEFGGKVSGVTKSGLFIRLDETGADGFIPISTLGEEYFVYDDKTHSLIGSKTGETHRLGDVVEVRLVEAQPFAGALRFELLSEGKFQKPPRSPRELGIRSRGASGHGPRARSRH